MQTQTYKGSFQKIRHVLSLYGIPREKMRRRASLTNDLGLHYLDRASLVMDLEDELQMHLRMEEVDQLQTLDDLTHWVYESGEH